MSDIGSDTEAQLSMMRDAYIELRAKNPNHELLKLAILHEDRYGFDFTHEYRRRCVRDGDKWKVYGYARYTRALEAAVKEEQIGLLDTDPPCEY